MKHARRAHDLQASLAILKSAICGFIRDTATSVFSSNYPNCAKEIGTNDNNLLLVSVSPEKYLEY